MWEISPHLVAFSPADATLSGVNPFQPFAAVVLVVWQRPQLFSLRSMGLRPAGPPACQPEDRDVRRDARARCTETHTGSATENKERKTRNKLKSSLPTRVPADRKPFSSSPKTFHLLSSHHKQLGEKKQLKPCAAFLNPKKKCSVLNTNKKNQTNCKAKLKISG